MLSVKTSPDSFEARFQIQTGFKMSPKLHEFVVVLQRDGQQTPWGIRLVGGSDLDTPLIITKVNNLVENI